MTHKVTTTERDVFHRWMRFRGKGDVICAILSPVETFQLETEAVTAERLGYLETLLNGADMARIEGLTGGLVLMREDTFLLLTEGS